MDNNAVSLDTVLINVESNAGKAAGNIGQLATHLNTLKNSVKGGFNNIDKLAKALENLVPALEKLKNVSGNLNVLGEITKGLSQLKEVKSPTGLKNTIDNLEKLPEIMGKMDTKTFENLARVSNELAQSLAPVAEKMQQVAQGYSAFSKIQNTFGKSASTSVRYSKQHKSVLSSLYPLVKRIGSGFTSLSKGIATAFGKGAYANMKKFHSKAKQVFLSLLGTRTLFTMIRKAASEYQAFDESLQKFTQNIWRAFGAQLAPVIEYAMELFKQFVRVIYSVVFAITGIDLIAKANAKAMASWGKSAKDTLGNLQKFDDLNVVEFDKDKGEEFSPIQMDKIDLSPIQKVIEWVRKLKEEIKEAWNSGEWYGVGEVLAEGINAGVATSLASIDIIREKFFEIGRDFGDFLNGIIENTQWENVGKFITEALVIIPDFITETLSTINWDSLGTGINNFFKGFNAIEIVNSIGRAISTGLTGIGTILAKQDWGAFGRTFGAILVNSLKGIANFIDTIPWDTVGTKIREAIESVPWTDVWDGIVTLAKESFKGLEEFISGLFDLDSTSLKIIETAVVGIGTALAAFKIVDMFGKLGASLSGLGSAFGTLTKIPGVLKNITTAFSLLGKGVLSTSSISGITGVSKGLLDVLVSIQGVLGGASFATIGAIFAGIVVAVLVLADAFRELWAESESFRNTVKEIGSMIVGDFLTIVDTLWIAIQQGIATLKSFYNTAIKPVFDLLVDIAKPILEVIINIFNILWKNVVSPFIGFLKESFLVTWDIMLIAIEALGLILKPVISILEWLWHKVLSPIVDFVIAAFLPLFDQITGKFKNWITTLKNLFGGVRGFLDDLLTAMRGGWGSFWDFLKGLINKMIAGFEKFLNGMIGGINNLSKGFRKIGNKVFDIIGVDIKFDPISTASLPRLETGTNEIPYEGIYHLHPGEAVVPKKYNPALGNGGSEEMNEKLDMLIDIMNNMNFTNVVNIGNKKVYEGQQSYNKMQQNKYGTINLY